MELRIRYRIDDAPDEDNCRESEVAGSWHSPWEVDSPEFEERPEPHAHVELAEDVHLPILDPGVELHPHAVYLDLKQPERGVFRALEGQVAGHDNYYIGQGDLPVDLWNALVQVCARAGSALIEAREHERPCGVTISVAARRKKQDAA